MLVLMIVNDFFLQDLLVEKEKDGNFVAEK